MRTHFKLSCRYHAQDLPYYCGPASAMMALDHRGIDCSSVNQADLFAAAQCCTDPDCSPRIQWHSTPFGLAAAINGALGSLTPQVSRFFEGSVTDAMRRIVGSLVGGHPSLVAVYRDGNTATTHWTLVYGLETDIPLGSGSPTVTGVWCECPDIEQRAAGHTDHDDCGAKSAVGTARTVNSFIPIAVWRAQYLIGTSYCEDQDFIVVCPDAGSSVRVGGGAYLLGCNNAPSRTQAAIEAALREIGDHELLAALGLTDIADLEVVDELGQVVARLDKTGKVVENYWLFALRDKNRGGFVGLIEIGCGGLQLRAMHLFSSLQTVPLVTSRAAAHIFQDLLRGREIAMVPSIPEIEEHLRLEWLPCPASWSSARPFFVLEMPLASGVSVRTDGFVVVDRWMDLNSEMGGY